MTDLSVPRFPGLVVTEATWEGHEVRMRGDYGDRMLIWSRTYPPPDRPEVRHDRESWSAQVLASELRDVVSSTTEAPL